MTDFQPKLPDYETRRKMARAKRHYIPGYVWHEESKWTQSIAVGGKTFLEKIKGTLGYRARGRKIICADDTFELREAITAFGNADNLNFGNTYLWNQ